MGLYFIALLGLSLNFFPFVDYIMLMQVKIPCRLSPVSHTETLNTGINTKPAQHICYMSIFAIYIWVFLLQAAHKTALSCSPS